MHPAVTKNRVFAVFIRPAYINVPGEWVGLVPNCQICKKLFASWCIEVEANRCPVDIALNVFQGILDIIQGIQGCIRTIEYPNEVWEKARLLIWRPLIPHFITKIILVRCLLSLTPHVTKHFYKLINQEYGSRINWRYRSRIGSMSWYLSGLGGSRMG